MTQSHSLIKRIAIGKGLGFAIGLLGFFLLPVVYPAADLMIRWGVLFWYTTVGAIIGVFGIFTWHPVLNLPLPWWFRAPVIGAWMNFVLALFAYDRLQSMMDALFGVEGLLSSPFWFTVEGGLIGLFIGAIATRFAGEGMEIVDTAA